MSTGIGAPIPRREDHRLLTGKGRFSDDVNLPDQLYAVFVRASHPHADLTAVSTEKAAAMPGVHAVFTVEDLATDGIEPIRHPPPRTGPPDIQLTHRSGKTPVIPPQTLLAEGRVRFVGEAVAMVVADTRNQALEAADAVEIEYAPRPAVARALDAAKDGAPLVWEGHGTNMVVDADAGDEAAAEAAFANAAHVVRLETEIQRVTGVPMEPRAAVGAYDPEAGRYILHAGSGGVVRQKREIAEIFGVEEDAVRVTAKDVGGNFGTRNAIYPEFPLVVWAAKRLGRPVKWTADRSEAFLSDYQGRDLTSATELALDADGRFLAIRGTNTLNVGAFPITFVPLIKGVELMTGVYDIPVAYFRAQAVFSNKPPVNNYRSSGRPEAMFIVERLIDLASAETGIDRMELRRRNLHTRRGEGWTSPLGLPYDCGDYHAVLASAASLGEWDGFAARKAEARTRGKYRGIGVANYLELTGGYPRERTEITVKPNGRVEVVIGTLSSGQGHETSFAQLITEWLSVPADDVDLVTGDTDIVKEGGGSHSARSMRMAGIVMGIATDEIIARGRRIAAHCLDAKEIDFNDGQFTARGTNRGLSLFEVARAAEDDDSLPDDLRGPLTGVSEEHVPIGAFPYGCHVCEVEVEPDTGLVTIERYACVDDVGRAINPLILHGQSHGGAVQGIGQAMWEHCVYDRETAQLLSGSFMDYPMPRAHLAPPFKVEISEVPSPRNKLGIRGGGEGGTTPALAVVINAIVDALSELGVRHVEMPATSQQVWRAIQAARTATEGVA
ncbi:MAG TPA: xanthine dehydrogenase family protein molybdopterin-binding subunit [Alphaproteobacteria bacterium]|nr:xanthine dehydrogenase family protein molybdopterin-binding subunit [Alphaproteobacteria bacterium]